jgi:hypothetical protein
MPVRLAAPLAGVLFAAAMLAGCGSSSQDSTRSETSAAPPPSGSGAPVGASAKSCDSYASDAAALRATNVSCSQARQVMYGWQQQGSCSTPAGASRSSCLTRSYRCLATRSDRGIAVSCARAGQSIAFVARRD